jgi:hypothetical protein
MRKISKILLICFLAGMIIQTGLSALAAVSNSTEEQSTSSNSSDVSSTEIDIDISQDVLNQIKANNPKKYDLNVNNYKHVLISLNVDDTLKQEVDRLILARHSVSDILIGYEFLYVNFGLISELESMVTLKKSGKAWESVFVDYNKKHQLFTPRTFESNYLEELSNTPSLTSDDIMIADRISHVTGLAFKDVIDAKLSTEHWKSLAASYGVLYSLDTLPTVPITIEQIEQYTKRYQMTEDQVVEAFVLAHKAGKDAMAVIERKKAGDSDEAIWADSYVAQYE